MIVLAFIVLGVAILAVLFYRPTPPPPRNAPTDSSGDTAWGADHSSFSSHDHHPGCGHDIGGDAGGSDGGGDGGSGGD